MHHDECTCPCSSEKEDDHFGVCIKYSYECLHMLCTFPIVKMLHVIEADEAKNSKMTISQVGSIVASYMLMMI